VGVEHSIFEARLPLQRFGADVCTLIYSSVIDGVTPSKITIAIPTYRRPNMLREALLSAINQVTKYSYNIIVVDNDASPDISAEIDALVRSCGFPNISLLRNTENVGMFGNWNRCLKLSVAPWVSILNDDDLLCAGFVETICRGIDEHPEADFFQVDFDVWDLRGGNRNGSLMVSESASAAYIAKRISWLESVLANDRAGSLGIAYRTKLANDIGGFDPREYPTADYCFNLRMQMAARLAIHLPVKQAVYRVGENESLRAETLQGFIENDFVLRKQVAPLTRLPSLMLAYAKNISAVQFDQLQKFWGVKVPLENLELSLNEKLPRTRFGIFVSRVISGVLIRFLRRFG